MKVLVINCRSSSIKYQVLDSVTGHVFSGGKEERLNERARSHSEVLKEIFTRIDMSMIEGVGHRIVHGGNQFFDSVIIEQDVIEAIGRYDYLAPVHNPANLAGILAAKDILPDLDHVAVFDTAFHSRMPGRSSNYALPADLVEKHNIRRFGFHGISHAFVTKRAAEYFQQPAEELRFVSCHLGNRSSACAVEYGHSIDTSMGMTSLEGLIMGTHSGALDPGVVIQLCRELGIDTTDDLLHRKSGLLGISGLTSVYPKTPVSDDARSKTYSFFKDINASTALLVLRYHKAILSYCKFDITVHNHLNNSRMFCG